MKLDRVTVKRERERERERGECDASVADDARLGDRFYDLIRR
jgi:hypothetical protein